MNRMFESNHGGLITYQLSEEELQEVIEKYGPPKMKFSEGARREWYRRDTPKREPKEPKINVDRYMEMKEEGMTDREICRTIHIRDDRLYDLKREWGLPLGKYAEWKDKVKA